MARKKGHLIRFLASCFFITSINGIESFWNFTIKKVSKV